MGYGPSCSPGSLAGLRWQGVIYLLLAAVAVPEAASSDDSAFFESRIRPLLVRRCYPCHSAATESSGGLRLDSRSGWEGGGEAGPAIVPGDPERSLLIRAVRGSDPDLQMPPAEAGGPLSGSEIADLEAWVKSGAFDPRREEAGSASRASWSELFAQRRTWWSLQPVTSPPVPAARHADWNSEVDRFLYDRLAAEGITASDPAPPETLIRRAALVLTGLPPTSDEVAEFLAAAEKDPRLAYARLIDRLLESPHYGERFARHWLDVVRFTETHGNEWNYDVPYAWRYRDYVIRAFQEDLPYDQFAREQIAGDLLAHPRWNTTGKFNESVIGTAFYRFGEVNHDSCVLFGVIGYDIVDNQLDTLTKAFQATTVACARCHDHKLDAVSTRDYHALLGILRSTRSVQHTIDHPDVNRDAAALLRALKRDLRAELARVWLAEAEQLDAGRLNAVFAALKDKAPPAGSPLQVWRAACRGDDRAVAESWGKLAVEHAAERARRSEFNREHFRTIADFRQGVPAHWTVRGMGLRDGVGASGDFTVATEGEGAVKELLPAGLYTFALSDKLNGALRSPTLHRTHGNVSFEVVGGRFSLTRLVFNNCQLDYVHQHSLHHDDWSWVSIKFPENTEALRPYAELLTFWDNPKFPDPLGTLGKDTENQRQPFAEHAKNPRTWWGVRRIVTHDGAESPRDEETHLARLYEGDPPHSVTEAAGRYVRIAREAVAAFAADRASDDDVRWLKWLLQAGLLSNKAHATPRLAELVGRYREIERDQIATPTMMPGMADEGDGFAQPLLLRGDPLQPGEPVERRYLEVLAPELPSPPCQGSGREEVAERIVSPANPLTSRVMVNRVWQWVFGRGLVSTPDDFGHLGELPTHPELLDHLATQFVADGWSVKRLVRSLVLSRAFQSSSVPSAESRARDPLNLLLAHYPARRVEAEVIRDSMLAVSGRLDPRQYGPSIHPYRESADTEKRLYVGPLDGEGRRSIYLKVQLMEAPRFLSAFNLPGGKFTQGRRDTSNVPAQSLALLNDPFVLAMADYWAGRLVADGRASSAERVDAMFRTALARAPGAAERDRFLAALERLADNHGVAPAEVLASRAVWTDAAHLFFNLKEFIFIP